MKRLFLIMFCAALIGGYILALSWSGSIFVSHARLTEPLTLERIEPIQARSGEKVQLKLSGTGFDQSSRLSLVMDAHNREAIVGRLPIPGYPTDMELIGTTLYVGNMHEGLQVFDVSDPLQPEFLGRSHLPVSVLDLEPVGEGYFALSCGIQGIKIAKRGAAGARTVNSIYWPGTVTESRYFAEHLYVAANNDGILVYDLADLRDEKLVQQLEIGEPIKKLLIYQGHLYVAAAKNGLYVYDLSQPEAPKLVKRLSAVSQITDIVIKKGGLYLVDKDIGVRRYRLEDPANPRHFKMLDVPGSYHWLYITENHLILADKHYGLLTIPLGQEMQRRNLNGQLDIGSNPKAKLVVGDYLYVGLKRDGLFVIDLSKVKPDQHLLSIDIPGLTYDLSKDGNWLYVASEPSGFQVVDLARKTVVATLSETGGQRLRQEGKRVFLLNRKKKEIYLVDVSDPPQPRIMHRYRLSPRIQNLAISGERLVALGPGGVRLYDLSDLFKPQLLAHYRLNRATDAIIAGDRIYVAADQQGMVVLEIINGKELKRIQSIKPPWPMDEFASAQALVLNNNLVFLANGESGLCVVDVKDPQRLKIVSTLKLPGNSSDLSIAGDFLTVSSRRGGLHYVDISNPRQPKLLTTIHTKGVTRDVVLEKGKIYFADSHWGVRALPSPLQLTQLDRLSTAKMKVEVPAQPHPGRYSLQITNGREHVIQDGVLSYLPPDN